MFRNGPFPWFLPAIGIYAIAPSFHALVLVLASFVYFFVGRRNGG